MRIVHNSLIEKGGNLGIPSQEVFSDTSLVRKVVKAPDNYNGFTIKGLYFGGGWMEE